MFLSNLDINITNSEFSHNQALFSDGGGIFLACLGYNSTFYLESNAFNYNIAKHDGGAVKWNNCKPSQVGNSFLNNSAAYAPEIASRPVRLKQI